MARPVHNPVGNPTKSVLPAEPKSENLVKRETPPVPSALGVIGAVVWAEVWEAGGDAYHPATDKYVIERYASLVERRSDFLEILGCEGFITEGSQGQQVAHPAAKLLADVESKMVALEDRLGLSPEARLRVGISALEHKSKFDAFMDDN